MVYSSIGALLGDRADGPPPMELDVARAAVLRGLFGDCTVSPRALGRYRLRRLLGQGAHGQVFEAEDPELGRSVAIKVLGDQDQRDGRARQLREARALARLSHANVVEIFDASERDGTGYIVMELVTGSDLGQWLRDAPSRDKVLHVFLEAARGLAAAHAAGLVHGDFKPRNVLVADDGQVKVVDFGLAHAAPDSEDEGVADRTLRGAGTPLYMAPEQHRGEPLTAAADQYAWATALWEALVGQPPFGEGAMDTLLAAKERGLEGVAVGAMPAGLSAAFGRALHPDAGRRFSSVSALIRGFSRRRRRRRTLAIGVAATIGLGGVAMGALTEESAAPCEIDAALRWDHQTPTAVRGAFLRTNLRMAQAHADRSVGALNRYATAWQAARTEACARDAPRAAAAACLDRQAMRFDALVDLLVAADDNVAKQAWQILATLEPPARCLQATEGPRVGEQTEVERSVRASVERAKILGFAGSKREAFAQAKTAAFDAEGLGGEVEIFARYWLADAQRELSRNEPSRVSFEAVYFAAQERSLSSWAARSATKLAMLAQERGDLHTEVRWLRHAETVVDAAGNLPDERLPFLVARARHEADAGDHEAAIATHLEARALIDGIDGDLRLPRLGHDLAYVYIRQGNLVAAEREARQAVALHERLAGRNDGGLSPLLVMWGHALAYLDRFEDAKSAYDRSLDLDRRLGVEATPESIKTLRAIAMTAHQHERWSIAEAYYRRTLQLRTEVLGPHHADTILSQIELAAVLHARGDWERSQQAYRTAITTLARQDSPDDDVHAQALSGLGILLLDQKAYSESIEALARALEIQSASSGPSAPYFAALAAGHWARAMGQSGAPAAAVDSAVQHARRMYERGARNRLFAGLLAAPRAQFEDWIANRDGVKPPGR